jgi:hypothetical protein
MPSPTAPSGWSTPERKARRHRAKLGWLVSPILVASVLLAAAGGQARAEGGSCLATYSFDDLHILSDPWYPGPNKWIVHSYVYVRTASQGTKIGNGSERMFGVLHGSTGDTINVGYDDLNQTVVGQASEDVTVWMKPAKNANRVKETNPTTGAHSVQTYGIAPTTITACTPGSYPFTAQDTLPNGALAQLDFTLTLANG